MDFVRIECPAMTQTLLGIGISLIGVLLICYREPIARLSKSMYGGLTFPLKWLSIGNLVAGILGDYFRTANRNPFSTAALLIT
jgi:hypothetical protein